MPQAPVDILLAVYNGERFLGAFLKSLLEQSWTDFRLLVRDNKSTDRTIEILRAFAPRFPHPVQFLPQPNSTVTAYQNFACVSEAAEAPYVMYADADDVWHKEKLEKTLAVMQAQEEELSHTTPILVHSDLRVVDSNLALIAPSFWSYQGLSPSRTRLSDILLQNCVTGCTMMINRALLDLGRPLPQEAVMHDHWYALVASALGRIAAVEEPLIDYRQHGSNDTGAKPWGPPLALHAATQIFALDGPRLGLNKKFAQARALLWRHRQRLSPSQQVMVEEFVAIPSKSFLGRRVALIRNGFGYNRFLRTVGLFLAI